MAREPNLEDVMEDFSKGLAERIIDCLPPNVGFAFLLFEIKPGEDSWVSCVTSGDREELILILSEYVNLQIKARTH